jgi:hypothetical protein
MTAKTDAQRAKELIEVNSWDEVPRFATEAEEAHFWGTHAFGPEMLQEAEAGDLSFDDFLPPPRPRTAPISIRLDGDTLARLKVLARRRHKGYQTMLKEFVSERLYEEEKRDGIIGDSKAS